MRRLPSTGWPATAAPRAGRPHGRRPRPRTWVAGVTAAGHGRRGRPWRRIRMQVLKRDPYCRIGGPRCTRISTTVDHIQPLSVAPHRAHDLTNLRGACAACNYAGGARLTNAKRRNSGRPVNGAHRARRQQPATTTAPVAFSCAFHADCPSVHSRPWTLHCRGSAERPCADACASGPSWCRGSGGRPI